MVEKDRKPDVELDAIVEGLAAIGRGDVAGGTDALRFAQDIQNDQEKKSRDKDPKK